MTSVGAERGKQSRETLLLFLLCIWSLVVFLIVDLFLNAPGLDDLRPRARFYRALRYAGHKMVGEPYRENDEFARDGDLCPVGHALQPDEWSSADVRTLLASAGSPEREEIAAILTRLQAQPDATLADSLLAASSSIPRDLYGDYALAAASVVAALCAAESNDLAPGRPPEEVLTGVAGDLALAALKAQSRQLSDGSDPRGANDWRAACITVERIGWVARGFERAAPFSEALSPTRAALARFLENATAGGCGSNAEVEALRLASRVGDEQTAEACLHLLRCRPPGEPARTREAFLVEEQAFRAVLYRGSARQRTELEHWLSKKLAKARGAEAQRYMERLQQLIYQAGTAPAIRDLVEREGGASHGGLRR